MPVSPEIIMTFDLDKGVEVRVNGVKGSACKAFSKPFEDAIGGTITSSIPTPEASQVATVPVTNVKS